MGEIQRSINQLSSVLSAGAGLLGKGIGKQVKASTKAKKEQEEFTAEVKKRIKKFMTSQEAAQRAVDFTNDAIQQKAQFAPQRDATTGRFVRKAGK